MSLQPRKPSVSQTASKTCGQQGEGGNSLPPLCSCETSSGGLHPGLGPLGQEGHRPVGSGAEEAPKNDCRDGTPVL